MSEYSCVYIVINWEERHRSIFWTEYQLLDYLGTCYDGTERFSRLRASGMMDILEINPSKGTILDLGRRIYYEPKGIIEYKIDREML